MATASDWDALDHEEEIVGIAFGDPPLQQKATIISYVEPSDSTKAPALRFTCPEAGDKLMQAGFIKRHTRTDGKVPFLNLPAEDIYVIISTKAGTGKAASFYDHLLKPLLDRLGYHASNTLKVITTDSDGTVRQLAGGKLREKAEKGVPQTVLLLSGDGGVVDLINGLLSSYPLVGTYVRPTIIVFPLGTGNALFQSLNRSPTDLSSKPRADATIALRSILCGTPKPLPIFRVRFSPGARLLSNEGRDAAHIPGNTLYGAIVASYGPHATLVADSDTTEWRKYGNERFGLVGKELLFPADGGPPHTYKARVIFKKGINKSNSLVEVEVLEKEEHGYVLLTLVSNLEKTFTISPASQPLDGKMRVVYFGAETGAKAMQIMQLASQGGKHVQDPAVRYEEVKGMRIETLETGKEGTWRRVCVDGTIVRLEEGGWMEVEKVDEDGFVVDVVVLS